MGKLLIYLKYVFLVFSSDIHEKRKHVHVRDNKGHYTNLCKFWLEPKIEVEYNYGFSKKELNEIEKLIIPFGLNKGAKIAINHIFMT